MRQVRDHYTITTTSIRHRGRTGAKMEIWIVPDTVIGLRTDRWNERTDVVSSRMSLHSENITRVSDQPHPAGIMEEWIV